MKKQAAVITGDIIQSSLLKATQRKRFQQILEKVFAAIKEKDESFRAEQYRGDSFQAVFIQNPELALHSGLLLQAWLRKENFQVRISIGTGDITFTSKNVVTSDGTAFQHSGPYLDELKKKNGLISIVSPHSAVNQEWAIHSQVLSFLMERWSAPQAEAILEQLNGLTQAQTAEKLKIRQPAVNQRLQAAGWQVITMIISRFELQISSMF